MSNIEPIPDFLVNQRIEDLIKHLNKKPSSFADSINKSATVITQIIKRRNKPSYDLLEAILSAYPTVNANWLMRGEGPMMLNETQYKKPTASTESNEWANKLIEHLERENKRLWSIIEIAGLGKSNNALLARFAAIAFFLWATGANLGALYSAKG